MISAKESVFFDNCKVRTVTICDGETIAASGTLTTEDIMPYLAGGEGYNSLQLAISGDGELDISYVGSADGVTYGSVAEMTGNGPAAGVSDIDTGLTSTDDGIVIQIGFPLLLGAKLLFTEAGGSDSITITAKICCKSQQ